ncbi:MAG: CBS domain-containing protein, partial [Anaerolineae bacterium]|nr:CBS domain-containing protein [Anaerolineae bacterium]
MPPAFNTPTIKGAVAQGVINCTNFGKTSRYCNNLLTATFNLKQGLNQKLEFRTGVNYYYNVHECSLFVAVVTFGIKYCFDDEELRDVARNMADLRVRRLPVVDREKEAGSAFVSPVQHRRRR